MKNIFRFIQPKPNCIFDNHSSKGIKLITGFRFGLSHLCEQKFEYSFQDYQNPICTCRYKIEATTYSSLQWPDYASERMTLLDNRTLTLEY